MPNKTLTRLLSEQGGLCFFCKKPLPVTDASVEHLVARANGGSNEDENCVVCCKSLNLLLGSKSVKEKIRFVLNRTGQVECPKGAQRQIKKTVPRRSPKATKLMAERLAQVAVSLKQPGKPKPRTVPKLKNMIDARFQRELSQDELDGFVQQLKSRGVISINGSKLTYA